MYWVKNCDENGLGINHGSYSISTSDLNGDLYYSCDMGYTLTGDHHSAKCLDPENDADSEADWYNGNELLEKPNCEGNFSKIIIKQKQTICKI